MLGSILAIALSVSGAPAATAPPPVAKDDKIICKRFAETGSLVKKRRVCHTKAQWARRSATAQEEWGELQGKIGNTRGN